MFEELIGRIALALSEAGVPYMLIGGQAVLRYGEPRLTQDIDVTVGLPPTRLDDLLAVVADVAMAPVVEDPAAFVRDTMVLPCRDRATGIRVDLVFSDSPYERHAIERARKMLVGDVSVNVASAEDLVVHKMVASRPRDLEDVRGVLLKNPDADLAYIRRWLDEFEQALDEPLSERFDELVAELAD